MAYFPLTKQQQDWQERASVIAANELAPRAEETDRLGRFPTESLDALRKEGLWGLRVPEKHGGLGQDMVTTCLIVEELSKKCPSTAMCYKMHVEGAELVTRISTEDQVKRFVEPLAKGEVFIAAPGGESNGPGDDWTPVRTVSAVTKVPRGYQLDGIRKAFVTSAGHVTHFEFQCRIGAETPQSSGSRLFIEGDKIDWEIVAPWDGLGMRGNSSVPMIFNGVVPEENLVGIELKDKSVPVFTKYMTPCLILTYGAAYLGIASGAFEIACAEGDKRYPSGARRLDNPINLRRMAEMSAQIEAARALLHAAAAMVDSGRAISMLPLLQAKVLCSEAGVRVTADLMTMFGGTAFAGRLPFERYFRDARAGLVMGQANDTAYGTIGTLLFPNS